MSGTRRGLEEQLETAAGRDLPPQAALRAAALPLPPPEPGISEHPAKLLCQLFSTRCQTDTVHFTTAC